MGILIKTISIIIFVFVAFFAGDMLSNFLGPEESRRVATVIFCVLPFLVIILFFREFMVYFRNI